ncbi:MAG: thioredoxin family protein [Chthoniobacterales bacterium]|nr:thioredoxin family protein [Chthoniobacterales bacterium]
MAPGWHTYWKFPGDAGIPTEIKWNLPAGWKVGELRWPTPLKLKEPGDIEIYGYHDEVLLTQEITPPDQLAETSVKLAAEASWLVCEKICIPGSASMQLELPVGQTNAAAQSELFARFEKLSPQPWPADSRATASWKRSGTNLELMLTGSGFDSNSAADFFPIPPPSIVVGHPVVAARAPGRVDFRIPIETSDAGASSIDGLVVLGNQENRRAWTLPAPNRIIVNSGGSTNPDSRGILRFLVLGLLGGFILNLMPCVLPVISLKIFGFMQQAGQSRKRILRSGLAFTAGIFAWFIGLAVVLILLKSAGHQITWAFQFTNPYFVLAMSAVVLVFALNLLGVFEIALPQSASRAVSGWSDRGGEAGSFFQGMFATILATPCTAPFLGTALGFAFTQSSALLLLMFAAIATGMSAPYLILCAEPRWLRFLPKPGPWMSHLKQLMGFLLLATLIFLLSVIGAERGLGAVIWTSCFLLALSLACWIKGIWWTPVNPARTRFIAGLVMALLVVTSVVYFLGGKFRATNATPAELAGSGDWKAFTPAALRAELDQDRPVFIDFTAAWCITCKFNEATVLESAAVRDAFQQRGVVKIRADWTNADPEITKMLKQFGRPGVPLYVLYPAGKSSEPIVFPELLTKRIVLDKLETIGPHVAAQ